MRSAVACRESARQGMAAIKHLNNVLAAYAHPWLFSSSPSHMCWRLSWYADQHFYSCRDRLLL